jgi:hypothetical protein
VTPPDARERLTQKMLGGLGVRPVGHPDPRPADDESPAVPIPAATTVPPPMPQDPPKRITDWWVVGRPILRETAPSPTAAPADDDQDETDETTEDETKEPTPTSGPVPGKPVKKTTKDAKRSTRPKSATRKRVEAAADSAMKDRRIQMVAFNGSAAAIGYAFGLTDVVAAYLPVAEHAAVGTFGLVLAVGAGWAAWKVAGTGAVQTILPAPPISRVILTVCAAELGRRFAPLPVGYLNDYGQQWGLGPDQISLLITAGGICAGLWWLIDRRVRHWHWTARWMARVPLASALLACLPYGSTPVV